MDRGALQLWKDFEWAGPFFLLLGSRMSWKMYSVTVVPWSESVPGSQEIILIKKRHQSTWPSSSCHNRGSSYPDDPYHIVIQCVTCVFFSHARRELLDWTLINFNSCTFCKQHVFVLFCFVYFVVSFCFVQHLFFPLNPESAHFADVPQAGSWRVGLRESPVLSGHFL